MCGDTIDLNLLSERGVAITNKKTSLIAKVQASFLLSKSKVGISRGGRGGN